MATRMSHHSYPVNTSRLFQVPSADEGQRLFVVHLKASFPKLCHPVQGNQMVLFFGRVLFELDYFLSKICQHEREREREKKRLDDV